MSGPSVGAKANRVFIAVLAWSDCREGMIVLSIGGRKISGNSFALCI